MILNDLMLQSEPVVASADDRVSHCAELMRDFRVGSVVIVDDHRHVVGILTDRDIGLSLGLGSASADSQVSEIMSRDVETVPDTLSVSDLSTRFREGTVKRFPVVNKQKRLVGVVSNDDVIASLARGLLDTCRSLEPKLGHMV